MVKLDNHEKYVLHNISTEYHKAKKLFHSITWENAKNIIYKNSNLVNYSETFL